tara:strand:+ start:123 stop:227 length:105 start_codon:yes stop_codon:yes gene_type:complete
LATIDIMKALEFLAIDEQVKLNDLKLEKEMKDIV